MKKTAYLETWDYGFVRVGKHGKKVFLIREMLDGERRTVSTRCSTEAAAKKEYERYLQDRRNYRPGRVTLEHEPLYFDQTLIDDFLAWSAAPRKTGGKENTPEWVQNQRRALMWWLEHLDGRNLKKLDLRTDILKHLEGQTERPLRIKVLKTVYAWLRQVRHTLKVSDDPCFGVLRVPQNRPEDRPEGEENHAVPWELVVEVLGKLSEHWKHIFRVHMATGWHVSELKRFAARGRVEVYRGDQQGIVAVLVCPRHKIGGEHRTGVDAHTLEAAKKVQTQGSFEGKRYTDALQTASGDRLTGSRMRATVGTRMIDTGATLQEVSTFLGHRSLETTRRWYTTHAVPRNPGVKTDKHVKPASK